MQWHVRFQFFRCREQAYCSSDLKLDILGNSLNLNYRRTANFIIQPLKFERHISGSHLARFERIQTLSWGPRYWFFRRDFCLSIWALNFIFSWTGLLNYHVTANSDFFGLLSPFRSQLYYYASTFASPLISRPDVWSSKNLSNFKRSRLVFRGTVMSTHAPMKRLGFEFFTQHR